MSWQVWYKRQGLYQVLLLLISLRWCAFTCICLRVFLLFVERNCQGRRHPIPTALQSCRWLQSQEYLLSWPVFSPLPASDCQVSVVTKLPEWVLRGQGRYRKAPLCPASWGCRQSLYRSRVSLYRDAVGILPLFSCFYKVRVCFWHFGIFLLDDVRSR